jgi:type II secretory pathway pseudopilin PulG
VRLRAQLHTLVRSEDGFTLPELITSMGILLTVMSGFTGLLVATTTAEVDMNRRFQAQTQAHIAFTKMRREIHCASAAVVASGPPARATLTMPTTCPTSGGNTSISWCTVSVGTNRFELWRYVGSACSGTGARVADYLTVGPAFTYYASSTTSLAKLGVNLSVNLDPGKTERLFKLQDDIVLRNSTRS